MNEITSRYLNLIDELINIKAVKDNKAFAAAIGVSTSAITEISKGRSNVGLAQIQKTVSAFPETNLEWLFRGTGNMFNDEISAGSASGNNKDEKGESAPYFPYPIVSPAGMRAGDVKGEYSSGPGTPAAIPVMNVSEFAGDQTVQGRAGVDNYFITLPADTVGEGHYAALKIEDSSMSPTIGEGSYVIIRLLGSRELTETENGNIYVISDIDGGAYVRRIVKNTSAGGYVSCLSDNPDKTLFPDFRLDRAKIRNVWSVEWILSPATLHSGDPYMNKLQELDEDMAKVKETLARLTRYEN